MRTKNPLNKEQLQIVAPSVFAEQKFAERSDKYTFIPTIRLVEKLALEGWQPVAASEQRVRREDRQGFQKHMLRFRKFDGTQSMLNVGDSMVEIVLINSHDGSSAYQLQAGLFRLVCLNGLVLPDSTFENIKLKHQGFDPKDVIDASYRVIEEVPRIKAEMESLEEVELTNSEQYVFAESALELKYPDRDKRPIDPAQLLAARRYDDKKNDLWHTFNRVQENMIEKGGLTGLSSTKRRIRTKPIRGIDENVKLNKALWTLADGMKRIKHGQVEVA